MDGPEQIKWKGAARHGGVYMDDFGIHIGQRFMQDILWEWDPKCGMGMGCGMGLQGRPVQCALSSSQLRHQQHHSTARQRRRGRVP